MTVSFRDRNVLITGGLGFIGSNLARRLVELGANVLLVDSLDPEYGGNPFNIDGLESSVRFVRADVRDSERMIDLIRRQHILFNLAGQNSHLDSMHDPHTDLEINCRAQLSILEACRRENPGIKVVFASTRQVYGKPRKLPVDESALLQPVDVNGINKMAGEWYHILYNNVYGIRACALRLTNTIGPRMRIKDARQTFLGVWIRLLLEDKPLEVWDGTQRRDFTFVDDAVGAFLLAAESEAANGQVYNLGGMGAFTLEETARMLVDLNGKGRYVVRDFPAERKAIDIGDYVADYRKIETALHWTPKTPLKEALERTLSYYRKNLSRYL